MGRHRDGSQVSFGRRTSLLLAYLGCIALRQKHLELRALAVLPFSDFELEGACARGLPLILLPQAERWSAFTQLTRSRVVMTACGSIINTAT
jgi:hypothetical protein